MSDMFCCRLRELRRKNGYTQSSLAKALGVSQSTIGNWEAGIRLPNLDTLERITRLFGISVGCFFGEQEIKAELEQIRVSGILLCLKFAASVSGIIYKKKAQCFVANAHGTGG